MKMRAPKIAVALALVFGLAACGSTVGGVNINKQLVGTGIGAGLGGLLGAQFGKKGSTGQLIGVGAGVFLGGLLGNQIGASLDRADQAYASQAFNRAVSPQTQMNQTIQWQNPQSGNHGAFTPGRTGVTQTGQYCREFQTTVTVGGRTQQPAYGVACQQPNGDWQIVQP